MTNKGKRELSPRLFISVLEEWLQVRVSRSTLEVRRDCKGVYIGRLTKQLPSRDNASRPWVGKGFSRLVEPANRSYLGAKD